MCNHDTREIYEGQSVCCSCGTILEQQIDDGPEWRYYGSEDKNDDPCRTGSVNNTLLPDSSYGSMAMNIKTSSSHFKHIIRLSSWTLSSCSERSWISAMDVLQTYAYNAGLPKAILVEAACLLKSQEDALKLRGETRRALLGAVFFIACRRYGVSRTHEEISNIVNVSTRSLCKSIQRFDNQLNIANPLLVTQKSLAERMMNGMSLSEDKRGEIMDVIEKVFQNPDEELEHTPKVMVAGLIASVLIQNSKDPKQIIKEFSKHCGVSAVSIQKVVSKC